MLPVQVRPWAYVVALAGAIAAIVLFAFYASDDVNNANLIGWGLVALASALLAWFIATGYWWTSRN
jgi:uncharacterized membrane protein